MPWSLDEPDEVLITLASTDNDVSFLDSARHASVWRYDQQEPYEDESGKYVAQRGWANEITVRRWDGFWGYQETKILWAARFCNEDSCRFPVRVGTDGDYFNVRRQCEATPNNPVEVTITATIVGHTHGDQITMFGRTANSAPYVADPVIVPEPVAVGVPSNESDQGTGTDTTPAPNPHADLIAAVRGYAAETENGQEHVDRWLRVFAAFGDDNGQTPMTAAEAQTYLDRGWTRWEPVVAALTALEAAAQAEPEPAQEPEPDSEPPACVSDDLRSDVSGYAQETHEGQAHVDRWLQVLAAFGDANGHDPMTAAEAQTYADRGWSRWDPVVEALKCLEARASGTQAHVPLLPSASSPAPGMVMLSNLSPQAGQVRITAIDDAGRRREPLTLDMQAGGSVSLTSRDLERGNRFKGLEGAAGPGAGDWLLELSSGLNVRINAHSLGADGALASLPSTAGVRAHEAFWFPSATGALGRQGLLRIVNRSLHGGTVRIVPHDAMGNAYPPLTLTLGAGGAANLDAWDLELGNAAKGLDGSAGPGVGDWRLELSSELDIEVLPYVVVPGSPR